MLRFINRDFVRKGVLVAAVPTLVVAALTTTSAAAPPKQIPLGVPDHVGFAVSDVDTVREELAGATGTQFEPVQSTAEPVVLAESGDFVWQTLSTTRSVRGGPGIEIVEGSELVGPWAATEHRARPFLSFSVDNVVTASLRLAKLGFTPVAYGSNFRYHELSGGVLLRVIDAKDVPPPSGTNEPQAPIDLGPPIAITLAPCDPDLLLEELKQTLGVEFHPEQEFPLPFEYSDGTSEVIQARADVSVERGPGLAIEVPHHAPAEWHCTDSYTPIYSVFVAEDVFAAEQQAIDAGMPWVARVPGFVAFNRTSVGGVFIEPIHPSFLDE